jgi:crooked neck
MNNLFIYFNLIVIYFKHERARVIYRYALDALPKDKTAEVFKAFTQHEKRYGERAGIETAIVSKRRAHYEQVCVCVGVNKTKQHNLQLLEANIHNYDAWFDYIRLMQHECDDKEATRDVFERAIAALPPKQVCF